MGTACDCRPFLETLTAEDLYFLATTSITGRIHPK